MIRLLYSDVQINELRVTSEYSYELRLLHELRVTSLSIARVTSYFLHMSYNKDKVDKAVNDNKVVIKNCSLGSLFDKELEAR